jgi:hypothetical protein
MGRLSELTAAIVATTPVKFAWLKWKNWGFESGSGRFGTKQPVPVVGRNIQDGSGLSAGKHKPAFHGLAPRGQETGDAMARIPLKG